MCKEAVVDYLKPKAKKCKLYVTNLLSYSFCHFNCLSLCFFLSLSLSLFLTHTHTLCLSLCLSNSHVKNEPQVGNYCVSICLKI